MMFIVMADADAPEPDAAVVEARAERPASFSPRLEQITVYAIAVERLTGKETALPAPEDRWPRADDTKTPRARP